MRTPTAFTTILLQIPSFMVVAAQAAQFRELNGMEVPYGLEGSEFHQHTCEKWCPSQWFLVDMGDYGGVKGVTGLNEVEKGKPEF